MEQSSLMLDFDPADLFAGLPASASPGAKVLAVVNTYDNPVARDFIHAVLTNKVNKQVFEKLGVNTSYGLACGMACLVKGSHVTLVNKVIGSKEHGKYYSPAGFMTYNDSIDVPLKWFTKEYVDAINRIQFTNELFQKRGLFLYKLWALGKNHREMKGRVESMVQNPDLNLRVLVGQNTRLSILDNEEMHQGYLKAENIQRGFYVPKLQDSVFSYKHGNDIYSMEPLNKVNERVTKIARSNAISIGKRDMFVIDDVPAELSDLFVTGSAIVPHSMLEQYGMVRMVSVNGMKATSYPMPMDQDKEVIIVSKASWKSGLNGVLACMGADAFYQVSIGDGIRDHLDELETNKDNLMFMGHILNGWFIEDEVLVTNFYNLERLVNVQDDLIEEEYRVANQTYYSSAISRLKQDPLGYQLLDDVMSRIAAGELKIAEPYVELKYTDMLNVFWSYGKDVHHALLTRAMHMHSHYAPVWMKASQKVFTHGYGDKVKRVSATEVKTLIASVYGEHDVAIGAFDKTVLGEDKFQMLMDFALTKGGMVISEGGYDFYMPPRSVLTKFIHHGEDGRVVFTGPWAPFFKLLVSFTNTGEVNWKIKHCNHMIEMQDQLLNDVVSRLIVKGRYYVALPKFWGEVHDVVIYGAELEQGSRAVYSKDPVLFDKAMTDVIVYKDLPDDIFNVSDKMQFALSAACFVHTDLLVHQGNDTDGDLVCIRHLGGCMPLYSGQAEFTHNWVDEYVQGEYDLKLKYKAYQVYSEDDLKSALTHSAKAKGDVGRMSANFYIIQHVLQILVAQGKMDWDSAVRIKELYAIGVQDEAMRQIKHRQSEGQDRFYDLAKYTKDSQSIFNGISAYADLVGGINPRAVGVFAGHMANMVDKEHFISLRSATPGAKTVVHYAMSKRTILTTVNLFMRAYYRNVDSQQPKYAHLNAKPWNGMSEGERKEQDTRKAFAHSYINSEEVSTGFWNYHGWIKPEGLNITSARIDVTTMQWVQLLKWVL